MEILGDDEEDRSLPDRPPVDPPTPWAPETTTFRPAAPPDGNPDGRGSQAGRNLVGQRHGGAGGGSGVGVGGAFARPLGGRAPVLDLGEQARDPAWEQTWNTGPVPLTTVRVEDAPPADPAQAGLAARTPPGGLPPATAPRTPQPAAAAPPAVPLTARTQLIGTIASPEAMGVAGVLMALGTSVSSIPTLLAFTAGPDTPRGQFETFAMTFALGGLAAAVLGVAACLRLRPDSHPLVKGLAGAAVILGIVLVVLAAFVTIQAGDLPADFESG